MNKIPPHLDAVFRVQCASDTDDVFYSLDMLSFVLFRRIPKFKLTDDIESKVWKCVRRIEDHIQRRVGGLCVSNEDPVEMETVDEFLQESGLQENTCTYIVKLLDMIQSTSENVVDQEVHDYIVRHSKKTIERLLRRTRAWTDLIPKVTSPVT